MTENTSGTLNLSHDGEQVFLEWSGPAGKVAVTGTDIDNLIAQISRYRRVMQPPVIAHLERLGPFEDVILNPAWVVQPEMMTETPLMHLRHPGLGWLTFLIPRSEASQMAEVLKAVATAQPIHHRPA